ncbi:MAG: hypothetical protein IKS54_05555 [Erysipelotrichaceae bacterium]|nr:hypothetical protein [Erysipelotrichaceae bacterium]
MEEKRLRVKKEKKRSGLHRLMADKKKRYLIMLGMMLPFIVAIGIFGATAYKEGKNLLDLAKGTTAETKAENIISSMNYILRDNPTDLQKEYFAQLKSAVEEGVVDGTEADDAMIASLVAKNYVADFYTWTNKRGQYDIGGFNFIYDGEYENGDHYKENVYQKARDGFYKYISHYGTQYGKENLLEVENVDIVKCEKMSSQYIISEHVENRKGEDGEWYDYRENHGYDAYLVNCRWNYKANSYMDLSRFATSVNLVVIDRNGRFEIVEASENTINARTGSEKKSADQTSETAEETSATTDGE